jgi:hypothetical protein
MRGAGESRRRTALPRPTSQLALTYSNIWITETCAALPCVGSVVAYQCAPDQRQRRRTFVGVSSRNCMRRHVNEGTFFFSVCRSYIYYFSRLHALPAAMLGPAVCRVGLLVRIHFLGAFWVMMTPLYYRCIWSCEQCSQNNRVCGSHKITPLYTEKNSRIHLDRLQTKYTNCKGIKYNTNSGQITGIQEELDTTCK